MQTQQSINTGQQRECNNLQTKLNVQNSTEAGFPAARFQSRTQHGFLL